MVADYRGHCKTPWTILEINPKACMLEILSVTLFGTPEEMNPDHAVKLFRFSMHQCLATRAQIHRYCLKIYPKICHKIIFRQKL